MRITLVTETYFPQVNGVSRTLGQLVGSIVKAGHQVQLLMPRYPEGSINNNGDVQIVDYPGFSLPFYREILLPLVSPGRIRKAFHHFNPDVVHIATEGTLGLAALSAARSMGIPVASSYHTNFPQYLGHYSLGWLEPLSMAYLRWFHNRTGCTLVPTREMKTGLAQQGFNNVYVWSRGVDRKLFNPTRRDPQLRERLGIGDEEVVFLYVGRLAPEKNLMTLVDAFTALNGKYSSRLLLVGDGPYRRELEGREDKKIIMTGYQYGETLAAVYASSNIFVFPSLTDTYGNVMQEAMASGLPVVAFDTEGPRSVVKHFETGLLVKDISAKGLGRAMERVGGNGELAGCLAEGALEFALDRDWDQVNSACLNLYNKMIPT